MHAQHHGRRAVLPDDTQKPAGFPHRMQFRLTLPSPPWLAVHGSPGARFGIIARDDEEPGVSQGLTLDELADLLDPPVTVEQVWHMVCVIRLQPCGHRRSGRPGRPRAEYDARVVMELHAVLVPFTRRDLPFFP